MNNFVVGWAPSGHADLERAASVLAEFVRDLSPLGLEMADPWRSPSGNLAVVTASHSERQALATYVHSETGRIALFAGRPIRWNADGEADGRYALDARTYLEPADHWASTLDGRCTVVRYDDEAGSLDVYADALGAYPVYSAQAAGTRWFSNRPGLLERLVGGLDLSRQALASFFACDWGLGGTTLWDGIARLPRASLHRFRRGAGDEAIPLLPIESIAAWFGAGWDADEAARALVETVRAMADWPGRKVRIGLSGGRDSRLVFAAAMAAGIDFDTETIAFPNTPGFPDTGDVVVARRVAGASGRPHRVVVPTLGCGVRETVAILRRVSNGLVSIGTTGSLTLPPTDIPLELFESGQGGEIARDYYDIDDTSAEKLATALYRHVVPALPRPIITGDAEQVLREYVVGWVGEHLDRGVPPGEIPNAFYLLERMSNWAGPSHGVYECLSDVTSPLWTNRLLPHQLGLSKVERERELFHFRLLDELAPELARLSFEGVNPRWPGLRDAKSRRAQRYRTLAYKIARELKRRAEAMRRRDATAGDPYLAEAVREAREHVSALPSHPAWDVLDRRRVEHLLARTPASLDPRSRRHVLNLVTIFGADNGAQPRS